MEIFRGTITIYNPFWETYKLEVTIPISRMSLFDTWMKNTTFEQAIASMTLPSKTRAPSVKSFLRHLTEQLFAKDEENFNICAICCSSINRYKRIDKCGKCRKTNIHDKCLKKYVKQTRNTKCPNCRHDLGDRYGLIRPDLRKILRNGRHYRMTFFSNEPIPIVNITGVRLLYGDVDTPFSLEENRIEIS